MSTFQATQTEPGVYRACVGGVPVVMLLTERLYRALEPEALAQLDRALQLPGLERVVITPDVHTGYGVPIGFTAVSASHLYPDTVGPDPACSVSLSRIAFKDFERLDKPERRAIIRELEATIAVTRRRRRQAATPRQPALDFDELWQIVLGRRRSARTWVASHPPLEAWFGGETLAAFRDLLEQLASDRTRSQIGSIGGGNHFLEVQLGDDGDLYLMTHFGSRGLGAVGAKHFFERIRAGMVAGGGEHELLCVAADEPLGRLYFLFQQAMLEYATFNHVRVQQAATAVLRRQLGLGAEAVTFLGHIPHNFIEFKDGRYWQRKGATPAYDNDGIPLLVPGSMATSSYLLAPGPNAARYGESVPHGAGRRLSRGAARRQLDQQAMDRAFDARGVMGSFRHVPLDESSEAYKEVDEVIEAVVRPGVATVTTRLRPVLVLKGE